VPYTTLYHSATNHYSWCYQDGLTMRLFCESSAASPFCSCKAHSLPPASPEMERIWESMTDETQRNSLSEYTDDENTPVFFVSDVYKVPRHVPPPLKLRPHLPSYTKTVSVPNVRDFWKPTDDNAVSDVSSVSDFSVLTPPPTYLTLEHLANEPDAVRAAHFVYEHVFDGEESPAAMFRRVEELMRLASTVNMSVLRSTLRKTTMLSFGEMWKSRSEIWSYVETTSHPFACVCPSPMSPTIDHRPSAGRYGTPARKLASFAGILFAHEILNLNDLRSCIDQLRRKPSCVALQSLHDLLQYAGDKTCKSKNREFMGELGVEQANRTRLPEFVFDHGAQILISEICRIISGYFIVQTDKREKSVRTLGKSRRQKVSIASWSVSSLSN